jgi:hypothetical protein
MASTLGTGVAVIARRCRPSVVQQKNHFDMVWCCSKVKKTSRKFNLGHAEFEAKLRSWNCHDSDGIRQEQEARC